MLELDRLSAPQQAALRAQYRLASVSEEVRQRLWRACDVQSRVFIQVYERILEAQSAPVLEEKAHSLLHGVYCRLFHHVGVQALHGLFRYEHWIPGRWTMLHNAYSDACKEGVVAEPYALDPAADKSERLSPEQEYLQILLLQRLNTGNLTSQQIDLAAEWLRQWVKLLNLAIQQPEGEGYWLDLGRGEGLIGRPPADAQGELLFLDIAPLREKLQVRIKELSAQSGPLVDEQQAVAERLDELWLPDAQPKERRGERHVENRSVTVAVGWQEIGAALTISALQRSTAPAGYHYDDYGRLRPNRIGSPAAPPEPRKPDLNVWQIHDASDSGFRIRSTHLQATRHRLGSLLALKVEEDKRWQLGVVRRMKKLNAEQTELGVEIIARNVTLVAPKPVDTRNTGYTVDGIEVGLKVKSFHALYLPGQSRARGGSRPSMVLPPPEFTVGRLLTVQLEGHHSDVTLMPPLERTKDWVWTPLELGSKAV